MITECHRAIYCRPFWVLAFCWRFSCTEPWGCNMIGISDVGVWYALPAKSHAPHLIPISDRISNCEFQNSNYTTVVMNNELHITRLRFVQIQQLGSSQLHLNLLTWSANFHFSIRELEIPFILFWNAMVKKSSDIYENWNQARIQ